MIELWMHIPGFKKYKISNHGRLFSCTRQRLLVLQTTSNNRCRKVSLSRRGKLHHFLVHRLVLLAFVGPCPKGHECNHIDGNPKNNRLENLEWITCSANTIHARDVLGHEYGRKGEASGTSKLTTQEVLQIRQLRETTDLSLEKLAKRFGVSHPTIANIIKRKTWKHI